MTISEMLSQSGLLTLLGMVVVFSFIIILIFCMKLLRVVVHAFKLDRENSSGKKEASPEVGRGVSVQTVQSFSTDEEGLVAAIAAAVHDKQLKL